MRVPRALFPNFHFNCANAIWRNRLQMFVVWSCFTPSRQHDGNMTEIGIPPLPVVRPDFDQMINPKKGSSCCSCDEGEWLPETKGSGAIWCDWDDEKDSRVPWNMLKKKQHFTFLCAFRWCLSFKACEPFKLCCIVSKGTTSLLAVKSMWRPVWWISYTRQPRSPRSVHQIL